MNRSCARLPLTSAFARLLLAIPLLVPAGALAQGEAPQEAASAMVAASADAPPEARPQGEQPFAIGTWPEGVIVTAGSIWVAQSGERSVARIDPATGRVQAKVKVGRLPVSLAAGPDGAPIVLVSTDRRVKRIDPKTQKVRVIATLPDAPEALVVDGAFAYVLLWKRSSSAGSSVMRIDLRTGKSKRSVDTGPDAFALTVGGGLVWVAGGDGRVATLQAETLVRLADIAVGGRPFHAAYGGKSAFVGNGTTVLRLSPETRRVTGELSLGAPVAAVAAWDDLLAVATEAGEVWLVDPGTMKVRARLRPASPYAARAITRSGEALLLTHHDAVDGDPDHGTLVRVPLPADSPAVAAGALQDPAAEPRKTLVYRFAEMVQAYEEPTELSFGYFRCPAEAPGGDGHRGPCADAPPWLPEAGWWSSAPAPKGPQEKSPAATDYAPRTLAVLGETVSASCTVPPTAPDEPEAGDEWSEEACYTPRYGLVTGESWFAGGQVRERRVALIGVEPAGGDSAKLEADARAVLAAWIEAQNKGDEAAYAALYGRPFTGVKRAGHEAKSYDRAAWLADRHAMFKGSIEVKAEQVQVWAGGDRAVVMFLQTWASRKFKDRGPKVLELQRDGDRMVLRREEMILSDVVMQPPGVAPN